MTEIEYEALKLKYLEVEEKLSTQDIIDIMSHLNIPLVIENSNYLRFKSGCHNVKAHNGGANLQYNIDTKRFTCFSKCNCSYNIFTLLQKRFELVDNKKSSIQCLHFVCDFIGIPFEYNIKVETNKNVYNWRKDLVRYTTKERKKNDIKIFDEELLSIYPRLYHQSWIDEGITIETMEKFGIRYYPYKNQIVIPCYDEHNLLVGARVRNLNKFDLENGYAKYLPLITLDGTKMKFPTNNFFYGIDKNIENIKLTKEVILVEAEKSVQKAETYLDKNITLGLYGSAWSKERTKQIIEMGVNKVIIALDFDYVKIRNGKEFTEEFIKFKEKCSNIADSVKNYVDTVEVVVLKNPNKDTFKMSVFDFNEEEFNKLINERSKLK